MFASRAGGQRRQGQAWQSAGGADPWHPSSPPPPLGGEAPGLPAHVPGRVEPEADWGRKGERLSEQADGEAVVSLSVSGAVARQQAGSAGQGQKPIKSLAICPLTLLFICPPFLPWATGSTLLGRQPICTLP